jgi:CP family cyanate transporter-like MFS transporter
MTAVYTTAMAAGTTAGAGLTVPIGSLGPAGDEWRTGLASWALFSAVAVLPWLPTLAGDRPDRAAAPPVSARALARSPIAWTLMLFFSFQSFQAYISFGWFAKFFDGHGLSESTSGWLVALLAAVQIPVSMVVPSLAARRIRPLLLVLVSCYVVAYAGMLLAPVGGAWLWMVLAGIGGGMFPVALTLIGLRARTAATTAALSAFVQTVGYVIAGSGPLLFGVLHGATGGWGAPMALLIAAMVINFAAGWRASRPGYVDDELRPRPAAS